MLGFVHRLMIELSPEDPNEKDTKTKNDALEVLNVSEKVIDEKMEAAEKAKSKESKETKEETLPKRDNDFIGDKFAKKSESKKKDKDDKETKINI